MLKREEVIRVYRKYSVNHQAFAGPVLNVKMDTCCNESESCAALIIGMYICFPFSDLSLDILPYQWIEMNLIFFDC